MDGNTTADTLLTTSTATFTIGVVSVTNLAAIGGAVGALVVILVLISAVALLVIILRVKRTKKMKIAQGRKTSSAALMGEVVEGTVAILEFIFSLASYITFSCSIRDG